MDEPAAFKDHIDMLFSPDGKRMAVSDGDGRVRFVDVAARREICTLHAHLYYVSTWAFSPSGEVLATGGYAELAIKLWSVADGKLLKTLKGHTDEVESLAYSPDGRHLASRGKDRRIRLWDVARGAELASFTAYEHQGPKERLETAPCVMFLPDGRTLAAFEYHRPVTLWDVAEALRRKPVESPAPRPVGHAGGEAQGDGVFAGRTDAGRGRHGRGEEGTRLPVGRCCRHSQAAMGRAGAPGR